MTCINNTTNCYNEFNCPTGVCPDFIIRRHSTKPEIKFNVVDCDGNQLDLTDLVCEVSMWVNTKLKKDITTLDDVISFADNIGFEQVMVGDIIVMNKPRATEQMLITGIDEIAKIIKVQRGYNGSVIMPYKKGSKLRIFRILRATATTEMIRDDILQVDGTSVDTLIESNLVYEWSMNDTCLPGCYWLEFKLLKISITEGTTTDETPTISIIPSVGTYATYTSGQLGCSSEEIEWSRSFPINKEGFLISITDSSTSESVIP